MTYKKGISHIDEKIRTVDKYALVKTLFNEFNVSKSRIINLIGIKKSSYYYWVKEVKTQRDIENKILYDIIKSIWQDSRKTYGAVRIHKKLRKLGLEVNIKRVRGLMKENQIKSIIHKKFRNYNKSDDIKEAARNILKRNFDTEKLNEKWVSDITYIWTRKDGWCYLSSIMDLHSRRIISHKVGKFMDIKLVIDTLKMAIYKRGDITDLIIHTDRGSQYMSKEYRKFCAKKGISISYSRKGNPYDNACIESFHATLKKEYVHNENFENLESLRTGMYEYIEIWYNNSRIHSKIGFTSPNEYEESMKKGNKEIA